MKKEMIIAIYHCSIKIVTRGKGKTAVASAAYISGSKIANEYDGKTHDYRKKKEIIHAEILLPPNAPQEFTDRSLLWNSVEKIEKNRNAQLARTVELALPVELSRKVQIELAREYCKRNFVDEGMVADLCIHDKNDGNPHAHIMLTMRPFNPDKTWGSKQKKVYELDENGEKIYDKKKQQYKCHTEPSVDWNNRANAELWRENWAILCNEFLEKNNRAEIKIDHRSYKRQGVEKIPTIHLGNAVCGMERKGITTEKGDRNREIQKQNREIERLKRSYTRLTKFVDSKPISAKENLANLLLEQLGNSDQFIQAAIPYLQNFKKVQQTKSISSAIAFLQSNNIQTLNDLAVKLYSEKKKYNELSLNVKSKTVRKSELDELLKNYQVYKQHRATFEQYESITNPKKRGKFEREHQSEIILFTATKKTLPDKLTPKAWTAELVKISKELSVDNYELSRLADDVACMETIRINVNKSAEVVEKNRRRSYGLE